MVKLAADAPLPTGIDMGSWDHTLVPVRGTGGAQAGHRWQPLRSAAELPSGGVNVHGSDRDHWGQGPSEFRGTPAVFPDQQALPELTSASSTRLSRRELRGSRQLRCQRPPRRALGYANQLETVRIKRRGTPQLHQTGQRRQPHEVASFF